MDSSDHRAERSPSVAYSVVIPVYNSFETIRELIDRLEAVFRDPIDASYEIVFIDDASPRPETWQTLEELSRSRPEVRAIRLMRNFGKPGAVMCGFQEARGRHVITLDDDLQQLPEDIPLLLEQRQHDVVMGRFKERHDTLFARTTSRIKGWFDALLLGKPRSIQVTPFKLFKSEIVKAMAEIRTPYPFIPALMFYLTRDVVNVEVSHEPRRIGKSGFTLKKKVRQFLNLLINNSSLLLQAVASVGILISVGAMVLGGVTVIRKLMFGISVSGWTSLMVALLVIGGLILFSLGVIGEYLIRIINGVERRPPFVVRNRSWDQEPRA